MSASASAFSGGSTARAEHHQASRTGLGNEWLGMILFIVSEAMMFGAIFAQYFYSRLNAAQWPPEGVQRVPAVPLALILTVILFVSGFTAHNAQTAIRKGDRYGTQAWLAVTIALGVVFLGGQAYEYLDLIVGEGFTIASGIYGSTFYTLTGLHGLHVTGGVIALIVMLARMLMGHFSPTNHFGLEGTILYWHFVDVVWFLLFAVVYVF